MLKSDQNIEHCLTKVMKNSPIQVIDFRQVWESLIFAAWYFIYLCTFFLVRIIFCIFVLFNIRVPQLPVHSLFFVHSFWYCIFTKGSFEHFLYFWVLFWIVLVIRTDIFYILLFLKKLDRYQKKCIIFFPRKLSFVKICLLYVRSKSFWKKWIVPYTCVPYTCAVL